MADTIYDVAIIGSGPAGYTAAIRAGQLGLKVALIESANVLGGTCLHVGCIPTKALLFNAELWDHLKNAAEYGIDNVDARSLNWDAVQKRKTSIVDKHTKGLGFLMKKNKVTVISGYGRLTGPAKDGIHTIDLTAADGAKSEVKTKNIILATGSDAKMIFGLKPDDRILTNIEMLSVSQVPKSLIVIGAGAVGVEFSSIFRSFGTEVTLVEFLPRLMPPEDEEISKELTRVFKKRGIDINTSAKVEKIEKTDTGVKVTWTANGKPVEKEAEKVLVAVGRAARIADVGIEKTKIEIDRRLRQSWRSPGDRRTRHLRHRRHRRRIAAAGPLRLHERHRRRHQNRRPQISIASAAIACLPAPTPIRRLVQSASPKRKPKRRASRSRSANFLSPATPRPPSSGATTVS